MPKNGLELDFALQISSKTLKGLKTMQTAVESVADDTKTLTKDSKSLAELTERRNKLLEKQEEIQEKLATSLDKLKGYAKVAAGLFAVKVGMESLMSAGENLDNMLGKGRIAFGGYTNALMAYKKFQDGVAKGDLFGTAEQFMDSSQILMRKGIDMSDDTISILNDWAAASGKDVTEVASAIESAVDGTGSAFEEFGITEKTMKQFQKFEAGTESMKGAVMNFVKSQKQFEGAAAAAPVTFENIKQRLGAMKDKFIEAIIGHTNDPNSLLNSVKTAINDMLNFISRNAAFIKNIAIGISAVLKWIFKTVVGFIKFLFGSVQSTINSIQAFLGDFKKRLAGFIMFIELIKQRFVAFFKTHEDLIRAAIKYFLMFKIAKKVLGIGKAIIMSVVNYGASIWTSIKALKVKALTIYQKVAPALTTLWRGLVRVGVAIIKTVVPALWSMIRGLVTSFVPTLITMGTVLWTTVIPALWAMAAALLANPVVWIVIAVLALVAALVAAVVYWDQIVEYVTNTAIWQGMATVFGWIIDKFVGMWETVKFIFNAVWSIFSSVGSMVYDWIVAPFLDAMSAVGGWLWSMFPDWLKNLGGYLWNSIKSIGSSIKGWFKGIWGSISSSFSDAWGYVFGESEEDVAQRKATDAALDRQAANVAAGTLDMSDPLGGRSKRPDKGKVNSNLDAEFTTPYDYGGGDMAMTPMTMPSMGGGASSVDNRMTVSKGAVVINTSGASPDQIAKEVEKALSRMKRNQTRKGR